MNHDIRDSVLRAMDPAGRLLRTARIDHRSITRDESGRIGFKGEAIVFNSPTWIGSKRWGFWEQIAPQAVTKTLAEADVRFVQNHDPNLLLARTSAGSLRLAASEAALAVDADMAPVSYAEDAAVLLEGGELKEMSFAFEPLSWEFTETEDGERSYTITELTLYDVSVVTWPAYSATSAGLRATAFDTLCRAAGLDGAAERHLMRELTGAPDEVLDALPARARDLITQIAEQSPAGTTAAPEGGERRDDSPPAATTGAPTTLLQDHLALRTKLTKETI
jgi:HK97 family phage prohead protease